MTLGYTPDETNKLGEVKTFPGTLNHFPGKQVVGDKLSAKFKFFHLCQLEKYLNENGRNKKHKNMMPVVKKCPRFALGVITPSGPRDTIDCVLF